MKNWLLITILLVFLATSTYLAFGQDEGYSSEQEWHEDCIWECIAQGNKGIDCLARCEEIADTGDAGTAE